MINPFRLTISLIVQVLPPKTAGSKSWGKVNTYLVDGFVTALLGTKNIKVGAT